MPRIKTVADLEKELLEKLQEMRGELSAALHNVDSRIALLSGAHARPAGNGRRGKRGKRVKAAKVKASEAKAGGVGGKPLKAFLVEALSNGGNMRARDLSDAVLAAGYRTKGKNFGQTVATALSTDKQFKRVSRGVYKLA